MTNNILGKSPFFFKCRRFKPLGHQTTFTLGVTILIQQLYVASAINFAFLILFFNIFEYLHIGFHQHQTMDLAKATIK